MHKFRFIAAAALAVGAAAAPASAQDAKADTAASAAPGDTQSMPAPPAPAAAAEAVEIAVGAEVKSADGVSVGTVTALDASGNVVIDDKGKPFALSKDLFAPGAAGALALKVTAKQLADARAGAKAAVPGRN